MRQALRRTAVPPPVRPKKQSIDIIPPIRGLVRNENIAYTRPGSAYILDNWLPTADGIRIRGGCIKYATISSGAVESTFVYKLGELEKFFAADTANIFDITSIVDPDTPPAAAVGGQTSGHYSTAMMTTAGGSYLYAVNGADQAQLYDGTSWRQVNASSSPISITGVDTNELSFVWTFAERLFFVKKNSFDVYYLPVDQVGGAATLFSLNGVFKEGGSLLFGATWSLSAGDGLGDKIVFVTTQGEAAIYEGTDPSDATKWRKVGVYNVTPPMGPLATMKAGGDLIIATEQGMVPISEAVNKDVAALSLAAITRQIEPLWNVEVNARGTEPWSVLKWPSRNFALVGLPVIDSTTEAYNFVVNLETGAWCRFTEWAVNCVALFQNFGYFGTKQGVIYLLDQGGNDDGMPYTATYVGPFDPLKVPGNQKTIKNARSVFLSSTEILPKISVTTDYSVKLPAAPNSIPDYGTDGWDSGLWDVALWDAGGAELVERVKWQSIGRTGFRIAPVVQVTSGVTPTPNIEFVNLTLTYEVGALMV